MPDPIAEDHKLDFSTKNAAHKVERMLDDAVADSFPASDPVSLAMPHDRIESSSVRRFLERPPASMSTLLLVGGGLLAAIAAIALRRR